MDTTAPASTARHTKFRLTTRHPTEFIDLTDRIQEFVAASGLEFGMLNVQSLHTTTAIVLNEHEPLLLSDFSTLLGRAAPFRFLYRHDNLSERTVNVEPGERANGHAHCRALLLGASAALNVAEGRLQLGRWQRIFLVELDGPRDREVSVLLFGEGAR
jgi:secondary thiamine-phosphate synthase enzyme